MGNYEDRHHLLNELRLEKNEAFEYLYRKYYHASSSFIRSNSGTENDARDIFQETLIVLCRQIRHDSFQLTQDIGAYLFAVSKNLWLYRLRSQKSRPEITSSENTLFERETADEPQDEYFEEKWQQEHHAIKELLDAMGPKCRKILSGFYFQRYSMQQLAETFGYSVAYVKLKKHRCLEALREKVNHHPAFSHE